MTARITCYQLILLLDVFWQASRKNGEYWVRSLLKCLNRRDVGADCHYNLVMARHCVGTFLTVLVRGPRSLLAETKLDMLRPILVQDCLHLSSVPFLLCATDLPHRNTITMIYICQQQSNNLRPYNLHHSITQCTDT